MAEHKSAKKSVRQDEKARMRNRSWKSRIKTVRKKVESAIEANEVDNMKSFFHEYESTIDRAVSKGVIHKNTGARKKMRLAQRLKSTGKTPEVAKTPVKSKEAKPEKASDEKVIEEKAADKKTAEKKTTGKKTPEKKTPEKKTAEKKTTGKKTPEKKTPEKKTADRKTGAKKPPEKNTSVK